MTTTSDQQSVDPHAAQDVVELLVDGGVATVVLNRPDAMNAVDRAVKERLIAVLEQVADDPQVRCVVLTGRGRAFCVGQDLNEHVASLVRGDEALGTTVVDHYNRIAVLLTTMNKPVVAALNGVTAGAGASMAFACDFRILVEGAGINLAFAGIALSCDTGSSWSLPRLVGTARATLRPTDVASKVRKRENRRLEMARRAPLVREITRQSPPPRSFPDSHSAFPVPVRGVESVMLHRVLRRCATH